MFPNHDFSFPAADASQIAGMRDELREIARELRSLAGIIAPSTELLTAEVRAQMERVRMPRAA